MSSEPLAEPPRPAPRAAVLVEPARVAPSAVAGPSSGIAAPAGTVADAAPDEGEGPGPRPADGRAAPATLSPSPLRPKAGARGRPLLTIAHRPAAPDDAAPLP